MASFNRVMLVGNLTRSPELRYSPLGTPILTFGIACNRKFKQGDELKEDVMFIDCVEFGAQAEQHAQVIDKGHQVLVEGRLRQRRWDGTDGQKHSKLEVVVEKLIYLTRKDPS